MQEADRGDEEVIGTILQSWACRETEVWECLSLLRALKAVLDDQTPSGQSWLKRMHRSDINGMIRKAGPAACMRPV